jgi:hypothetical protein
MTRTAGEPSWPPARRVDTAGVDRRSQFGFLSARNPIAVAKLHPNRRDREKRTLRRGEDTHRPISGAFYFDAVVRTCALAYDAVVFRCSRGRAIVAELAHDTAPAGEVNGKQCCDRPSGGPGAERREFGRETIGLELE